MKISLDVACRLMYRPKKSLEEYEENGLNKLLERMYYNTKKHYPLASSTPLPLFNAAYAIAVAMVNTCDFEGIADEIRAFAQETCQKNVPPQDRKQCYDAKLCRCMVVAILQLQEDIPTEARSGVMQLRRCMPKYPYYALLLRMINSVEERFRTNLRPCDIQAADPTNEAQVSQGMKEVLKYCIDYVSDIGNAPDPASIKGMLEKFLLSPLAKKMEDSDLQEMKDGVLYIGTEREKRKKRKEEEKKKEQDKVMMTQNNNYYGSIGNQINSAQEVGMK